MTMLYLLGISLLCLVHCSGAETYFTPPPGNELDGWVGSKHVEVDAKYKGNELTDTTWIRTQPVGVAGELVAWRFQGKDTGGTVHLQIWRPSGDNQYTLVHRTSSKPSKVLTNIIEVADEGGFQVEPTDHLGVAFHGVPALAYTFGDSFCLRSEGITTQGQTVTLDTLQFPYNFLLQVKLQESIELY